MRILHLIHRSWPYHGGAERYVWEHALASRRHGHSSTVVTTCAWDMSLFVSRSGRKLPPGRFIHQGVEIIRFPVVNPPCQNLVRALFRRMSRGGPDRFFFPNPLVPAMDRWLSGDHGYDLVHANAMPFLIHGGYRYAKKHAVPLVTVPHANLGSPGHRILPIRYFDGDQRKILRESELVVAQNGFESSVYANECGVDQEKIMVHGSGVDPSEWAEASGGNAVRALSLPKGVSIVLSVTAHCFDKGSFTLLDACIDLWKTGTDFILVMAGPVMDDFRLYLDRRISMVPAGRIVITGYIDEETRKNLFRAASVVAAPSRLDAFGIVVLDGWMGGAPVIGCNAGGMPDIIDDGADGYLVDFGDTEGLSRKIGLLLGSESMAESLGLAGRKKAESGYTWSMVTDRFYEQLEQRQLCRR